MVVVAAALESRGPKTIQSAAAVDQPRSDA